MINFEAHMKHIYATILLVLATTTASAQWYVELGVTNSNLSSYSTTAAPGQVPTPTDLDSYSGLRDFSYGFGYLFSLKSKEARIASNGKPAFFRLGIGAGFEQSNLRTNATIHNVAYPNIYNLAQAQGRLGIYLTPVLFRSKQINADGSRSPRVLLDLHAGAAHNLYTSATQHYGNTLINLLHDSNEFNKTYSSYFYGAGVQFSISKYLQLYARYAVDNAFEFTEINNQNNTERYRIYKDKASIGLVIDLSAKRRHKKEQQQQQHHTHQEDIAALSSSLQADIQSLQARLVDQEEKINMLETEQAHLDARLHPDGFKCLFAFTAVHFALNDASVNESLYGQQLTKVAQFLEKNPKVILTIVGYADPSGAESLNMKLSHQRAEAVKDYLMKNHSVSQQRMIWLGAGETKRFDPNTPSKNRRTELYITTQE